MSAIDQITAHYNANKQQHIDVPEWGVDGKPLRVFWQLLTIEKREALIALPGRSDVDTMVALAEDENGTKLFTLEDKPKLKLAADAAVITRVARKMIGIDRISDAMVENAGKN